MPTSLHSRPITTLTSSITSSVTTIPVASITNAVNTWGGGFTLAAAECQIDSERITFTGASGGNLTGCVRGAYSTTAAAHSSGAFVAYTSATSISAYPPQVWIAPTLINSWANFGSGFETAGYLKDALGFVHLKGVITGGSSATTAFTLPAGYIPGASGIYASAGGAALAAVTIGTTGAVQPTIIGGGAIPSLSGIVFLAEL